MIFFFVVVVVVVVTIYSDDVLYNIKNKKAQVWK